MSMSTLTYFHPRTKSTPRINCVNRPQHTDLAKTKIVCNPWFLYRSSAHNAVDLNTHADSHTRSFFGPFDRFRVGVRAVKNRKRKVGEMWVASIELETNIFHRKFSLHNIQAKWALIIQTICIWIYKTIHGIFTKTKHCKYNGNVLTKLASNSKPTTRIPHFDVSVIKYRIYTEYWLKYFSPK